MKGFIAVFFVFVIGFFLFPSLFFVSAQSPCPAGFENLCKIKIEDNPNIVGSIVQLLIIIAITLSVIFLIIGGIRWIMSGGDKAKVEQAKSAVTAAIVGLLLSLLAYGIVNVVLYLMGGDLDLNNLTIPRLV